MLKSLEKIIGGLALLTALTASHVAAADNFNNQFWNSPLFDSGKIKHVFVIVLENEDYDVTFAANSKAPYLSKTLASQGALLNQDYGVGHASLDNYIAMISGQSPNTDTRNDCQTYSDFQLTGMAPYGQALGRGCVYPASIKTVADQLKAARKTWRGYMEDMGNDPSRESATCGHPMLNTADLTQSAEKPSTVYPQGDQYATRHNPFAYFHSIIDSVDCQSNVVNLTRLQQDLRLERRRLTWFSSRQISATMAMTRLA